MFWSLFRRNRLTPQAERDALRRDLASGNAQRMSQALMKLKRSPKLRLELLPAIVECLRSRDEYLRRFAGIVALGADSYAAPHLVKALVGTEHEARAALELLRRLGAAALPAVRNFLWTQSRADPPNQRGIEHAFSLLAALEPDPVHGLCNYLDSRLGPLVVDWVAKHPENAVPSVLQVIQTGDNDAKQMAVEALRRLGDPGFHALIDLLIHNHSEVVQAAALEALNKKRGSFFDLGFFAGWRSPVEAVLLLMPLVEKESETASVASWLVREFASLVPAEERERVDRAAAFVLMGNLKSSIRAQLERVFSPEGRSDILGLRLAA